MIGVFFFSTQLQKNGVWHLVDFHYGWSTYPQTNLLSQKRTIDFAEGQLLNPWWTPRLHPGLHTLPARNCRSDAVVMPRKIRCVRDGVSCLCFGWVELLEEPKDHHHHHHNNNNNNKKNKQNISPWMKQNKPLNFIKYKPRNFNCIYFPTSFTSTTSARSETAGGNTGWVWEKVALRCVSKKPALDLPGWVPIGSMVAWHIYLQFWLIFMANCS